MPKKKKTRTEQEDAKEKRAEYMRRYRSNASTETKGMLWEYDIGLILDNYNGNNKTIHCWYVNNIKYCVDILIAGCSMSAYVVL